MTLPFPTRRAFGAAALLLGPGLLAAGALPSPARAELYLDLRQGNWKPLPIAVTDMPGEGDLGQRISGIITNNLKRSGLFAPVERGAFPERTLDADVTPRFEAWKAVNAQALVTGRVSKDASGRVRAEFRLWDVYAGQQLAGQQYFADPNNWRRVAHIISDAIYARVTGEKGFFDSRVVFVDETGPKENRRKRLAIMDQDGANVRYLTRGEERVFSPRYSPTSQEITYVSQRDGEQPRVHVLNIATGQRQVIGDFPDMSSSTAFSPDGAKVVLSLQQGGNANLYAVDLRSRATTRLTNGDAIDTAPSFSPDGRQIVFESDRGGAQQIYLMGADGSGAKRLSFGDGSYSQPVWSPKGDLIAFTKRKGGQFAIGVMRPDGSGERILTEGFHNEAPTWAPNGRYLMFFRDPGGASGGKIYMVDTTGRVENPVPTPAFGSDPAWSPLLN